MRGLESTPGGPVRVPSDCEGFPEVNIGATDREMPISIKPELSQTVLILGSLWLVTALGSSAAISRSRHDSTPTAKALRMDAASAPLLPARTGGVAWERR
ncbi:hypothetical protein EMIHUDRAFT_220644 [Emiliania huxleyi CCMP1516]|uniref:Uncharacterized protein n=2 Tax=Emiliania huxleyi TaxID=2903 RepID=A0A0D3I0S1_EMIH1|nr:hypothetical protein EMIHUDRAFT_220644 [Emiliania huxleyi CCMP1516]EOD04856.1 hypothetical protein EMIHUDRAFT_220644 [Emiliania huxleyi CCMP1516]|eukprot:XP_005757285.1 hypothetical protein EMIHUDRAFT_220644 [Emiliania huxleyi CCMP1516]